MAALGALAALVGTAGCGGREANAPLPALGFNDDWATYSPSPDPNRDPFKLAKAIGVKVARGRTRHGFGRALGRRLLDAVAGPS